MVSWFLSKLGILTPAFMRHYRRHSIVGIFIIAAFLTPGTDPVSQILLAIPLLALYEVSIWISAWAWRGKKKARRPPDPAPNIRKPLTLQDIAHPIQHHLDAFDHVFRDSIRSRIGLVDLITKYIVRQKGKEGPADPRPAERRTVRRRERKSVPGRDARRDSPHCNARPRRRCRRSGHAPGLCLHQRGVEEQDRRPDGRLPPFPGPPPLAGKGRLPFPEDHLDRGPPDERGGNPPDPEEPEARHGRGDVPHDHRRQDRVAAGHLLRDRRGKQSRPTRSGTAA